MLSAKKSLTLALVVPHVLLYAQTHALALPYSIKGQCGIEIQIDFYERR